MVHGMGNPFQGWVTVGHVIKFIDNETMKAAGQHAIFVHVTVHDWSVVITFDAKKKTQNWIYILVADKYKSTVLYCFSIYFRKESLELYVCFLLN